MASPGSNARYTPVANNDPDRDSAPGSPQSHDRLIPHIVPSLRDFQVPETWSTTFSVAIALRVLSLVFSLVPFIIFIIDGYGAFIAADIFVAFIMILDVFMIIHHSLTNAKVFRVTVEVRNSQWQRDIGGSEKLSLAKYFDLGFTVCFMICIIVGNALRRSWWGGDAWIAGVIFGYFIV